MPKWSDATVVAKKIWTAGLFTLTLKADRVSPFEPGQFLHLALDDENGNRINRAYSVASPHGELLDFFIVLVPDGQLTPRLWRLSEGDQVYISEKAAGRFSLNSMPRSKNLWLVATGTGLAPYIAILRDPVVWQSYQKIVLMHGVRYADDLAYQDELKQLAENPERNFCYLPALTRQQVEGIFHGRLTQMVATGAAESESETRISAEETTMMLCGNPAMLDAMVKLLETKGLKLHRRKSPGQIVMERYW